MIKPEDHASRGVQKSALICLESRSRHECFTSSNVVSFVDPAPPAIFSSPVKNGAAAVRRSSTVNVQGRPFRLATF